jgi:hypothetical protein
VGVADDDVADDAVAPQQHSHLAAETARHLGQVARQLRRHHLPRIDAPAVGALEGAQLGRLDAAEVAVDRGWDGGAPVN